MTCGIVFSLGRCVLRENHRGKHALGRPLTAAQNKKTKKECAAYRRAISRRVKASQWV